MSSTTTGRDNLVLTNSQPLLSLRTYVLGISVAVVAILAAKPDLPRMIFELLWTPSLENVPYVVAGMLLFKISCFWYLKSSSVPEDWARLVQERTRITKALIKEYILSESAASKAKEKTGGGTKEENEEEEKKRVPPVGKDLFYLVWDEIEGKPVTDLGVDKNDPQYLELWALFKLRIRADLDKAVVLSRLSLAIEEGSREWNEDSKNATKVWESDLQLSLKQLKKYSDGSVLQEMVSLIREDIEAAFGKNVVVPEDHMRKVEKILKSEMGSVTWMAMEPIWIILKPILPITILSMTLLSFESAVSHIVWNGMQNVLDSVKDEGSTKETLSDAILAVLVKLCFIRVLDWIGTMLFNRCYNEFKLGLQNAVMTSITRQDTEYFDFNTTGVLQERLGRDVNNIADHGLRVPRDIFRITCHVVGIFYVVWTIDKEIFMIMVLPLPFFIYLQQKIIQFNRKVSQRLTKMNESGATSNSELLKNFRTVREFVMEGEETRNYSTWNERKREICENREVWNHSSWALIWTVFSLLKLICFKVGGERLMEDTITYGQVLQATAGVGSIVHCVRHLSHVIPQLIKMLRPLGRICTLLKLKPTIEPDEDTKYKCSTDNFKGTIEFKNVHFTFPSEPQKPILKGLSFKAGIGEKVAFVGATGCGKSTAIQIIESFYRVSSGEVLIDGESIEDYKTTELRRVMSIVAQDNIMFSTTIRENILYGLSQEDRAKVTDADIVECCEKANAMKFINEFPRKLETFVGERGQKLSGGQKQRLAIARAIIRNPTILLLDEATSALDAKAEKEVQTALDKMIEDNKQGCTLIIAHRLTTIMTCDSIVVMDKGVCVEQGPHSMLMKIPIKKDKDGTMISGYYHDLWDTQMKGGDKEATTLEKRNTFLEERVARLEQALLGMHQEVEERKTHQRVAMSFIDENYTMDFDMPTTTRGMSCMTSPIPAPRPMQRAASCT